MRKKTLQVVFIEGMTASGKSSIALELAEKFNGCVVNCDSIQCYEHLGIGAAMPTENDFQRVPHFLYRFVKPFSEITAGIYSKVFFEELKKIEAAGFQNVFVVGGTGFYFQAIEKGMFEAPAGSSELKKQLENEAEERGFEILYEELILKDPAMAAKIHPHDHYRILRSLEILRSSNKLISELKNEHDTKITQGHHSFPYPLRKFALDIPREELLKRIEKRTIKMLSAGLIEEVEDLIRKGLREWAPLKSVGYAECLKYLQREIETVAELKEAIIISTRQLAKKQKTWFKRDANIEWVLPVNALSRIESVLNLHEIK